MAQDKRKIGSLEDQITANLKELETVRTDLSLLQHDMAHYQDTIKQKDRMIAFLQAHISQLTQSISQLSLPLSREGAKKKGWWRFWG
jgi:chromosome segregation ATPase